MAAARLWRRRPRSKLAPRIRSNTPGKKVELTGNGRLAVSSPRSPAPSGRRRRQWPLD